MMKRKYKSPEFWRYYIDGKEVSKAEALDQRKKNSKYLSSRNVALWDKVKIIRMERR